MLLPEVNQNELKKIFIYHMEYLLYYYMAYQRYINSKPWVKDNYLRKPDRKPQWIQ